MSEEVHLPSVRRLDEVERVAVEVEARVAPPASATETIPVLEEPEPSLGPLGERVGEVETDTEDVSVPHPCVSSGSRRVSRGTSGFLPPTLLPTPLPTLTYPPLPGTDDEPLRDPCEGTAEKQVAVGVRHVPRAECPEVDVGLQKLEPLRRDRRSEKDTWTPCVHPVRWRVERGRVGGVGTARDGTRSETSSTTITTDVLGMSASR